MLIGINNEISANLGLLWSELPLLDEFIKLKRRTSMQLNFNFHTKLSK